MASLPILSGHDVVKAFAKDGWQMVRQRGSHMATPSVPRPLENRPGNLAHPDPFRRPYRRSVRRPGGPIDSPPFCGEPVLPDDSHRQKSKPPPISGLIVELSNDVMRGTGWHQGYHIFAVELIDRLTGRSLPDQDAQLRFGLDVDVRVHDSNPAIIKTLSIE
jgi:hypothetical protein